MKTLLFFMFACCGLFSSSLIQAQARISQEADEQGLFSGRVDRINPKASLLRVKLDFANFRYINKGDQVEFWNEYKGSHRCEGHVIGKSDEFMLLKMPHFSRCTRKVALFSGIYLKFFAKNLVENLKKGQALVVTLRKKHLALSGMMSREKVKLDSYEEKVNVVNKRYEVLLGELAGKRRREIIELEEEKNQALKKFKDLQIQLNELDFKLERYRIHDENLAFERWSLDSHFYFKK